MTERRLLAIVTDGIDGPEPLQELRRYCEHDDLDLRVVVPAVQANVFEHTLGDIDEPRRRAEERLRKTLEALRASGCEVAGEVGDPDPIQAAQDALLKAPADEVLIFEHEQDQARWFEEGMFERAKAGLEPPLRMVVLDGAGDGSHHVIDVETAGAGTEDSGTEHEVGTAYLPGLSRGDFAGMVVGVLGTIAVIILAAVATAGAQPTGWQAAAILIAIFTALINMAHVVGLTLMESVRYRGGFAKFFRDLALIGTPLALVVNLLILLLA